MRRDRSRVRVGTRNVLSVLLSFALVMSGVPAQAYASESNDDRVATVEIEQSGQESQYQQSADLQPQDGQTTDAATNAVAPEASPEADETLDTQVVDTDQQLADENEPAEKLEGHLHLIQNGEDPYAADETSPLTVTPGLEGKLTEEQYQTLRSTFSRMMASVDESDVDMTPYHLTYNETAAIAEEVINYNPDFWYVGSQFWYSNNSDGMLASISFVYQADRDTLKKLQSKYRAALDEAVSWVPQNASTAEKVKAAHDWLVRNVAYNEEAAYYGSYAYPHTIETDPWSAYGALVAKSCVCQGYALAFSAILNAVGIESNYAHTDNHVWNRVLVDGSWYHVDVTWDDPVPDSGFDWPPSTEYFLKSDQGLRSIGDRTHQEWWLSAPACSSTKYDNKRDWPSYREPAGNKVKVTSFELSSTALTMGMNESAKLEIVNKTPANATTYGATWTSSNENVASVDSSGGVYARGISGTTKITCTIDGISRTCEVTVRVTVDDFSVYFPDAYDVSGPEYEYKGSAWEPEPDVELGGKSLELGKDYTLSYRDNVNVGTATMTITGKGAYTGTKEIPFKIAPLQIAFPDYSGNLFCDVAFSKDSYTYTGKPVEPKPVITYTGIFYDGDPFELVEGRDYKLSYQNNVDPGSATIIVTGINNCEGEFEEWFYIDPEPIISQADISLVTVAPIATVNYNGKAQTPKPVVTYEGRRLEEGIDYTLSYKNNVNPGTATVTLTGIGEYEGSKSVNFTIVKAKTNLANASIAKVTDRTYTGKAIKPTPDVTYEGEKLAAGTDFTFSYNNNVNAGTASLKITGKGNYTGSKTVSFKIAPADIAQATVSGMGSKTYTGSAIKPAPTVTFGSATLAVGTDYSVAYDKNVNVGTATVTVAGKGNFTGTKGVTFKIVAANLSKASVDAVADQRYTGAAIKPVPVVKLGTVTLKVGTDYTVSYKNNVEVGTATVTIAGKGNYMGSKSVTFKIARIATTAMHRLYNPHSGEHFYTAKAGERDALVGLGWVYEGVGWTAPERSGTPVYRLYNPVAGDHHYTMKAAERDALKKAGWKYEGVGWYSDDAEGVPLYRQYNPNALSGSHNYTTNKKENDALVKMGWKAEGVGWYGVKQ